MGELWFQILICFLAGAGAGLGTGFAGMSAATVISPMLVTFLGSSLTVATHLHCAGKRCAGQRGQRPYLCQKRRH